MISRIDPILDDSSESGSVGESGDRVGFARSVSWGFGVEMGRVGEIPGILEFDRVNEAILNLRCLLMSHLLWHNQMFIHP
jgi:hypothetical protein